MAQKTRHEQQIVPKSSPIGQGFLGSRMVRKFLGTKRFVRKKSCQEAVWAKSGMDQKWCGPKVVRNPSPLPPKKKKPFSFTQPRTKNVKTKKEKIPKSKKMEKCLSSPASQTKKSKNQKINNKIKKIKNAKRKKIKSKYCSNKNIFSTKLEKSEKLLLFSYSFSFIFIILFFCDVLGFWSTKNFCFPKKRHFVSRKSFCIPKKVFCIPKIAFCTPKKSGTLGEITDT